MTNPEEKQPARVVFTVPDFVDEDGISYTDIEITFESDSLTDAARLASTLLNK
jgi:hypothetical protein